MNEKIFELLFFLAIIAISLFQSSSKKKKKDNQPPGKGILTTIMEEIRKAQEASKPSFGPPENMESLPRELPIPEYLAEYEEIDSTPMVQAAAELPFDEPENRAPKKKEMDYAQNAVQPFPASLKNAFIWSEIISPPISKRKQRRLFRG